MHNNINQQLQQYSDRIRDCIQNAGYYVSDIYEFHAPDCNGIHIKLRDQSGECTDVCFEKMDNNQWNYHNYGTTYSFDNFDKALESFNQLLHNNALTSAFNGSLLNRRIIDLARGNGFEAMNNFYYHNGEMNKIDMLIYIHGSAMRVTLERTPHGQWKLTNRSLEQEGRIFQNMDDALISFRDQLRSAAWRNYHGNNMNVNNHNANHQTNANNQTNHYNSPN